MYTLAVVIIFKMVKEEMNNFGTVSGENVSKTETAARKKYINKKAIKVDLNGLSSFTAYS